jgi:hypothetical protein
MFRMKHPVPLSQYLSRSCSITFTLTRSLVTCVSIVLFADFLAVVHTVRMSARKSRGGVPNGRSCHGSHLNTSEHTAVCLLHFHEKFIWVETSTSKDHSLLRCGGNNYCLRCVGNNYCLRCGGNNYCLQTVHHVSLKKSVVSRNTDFVTKFLRFYRLDRGLPLQKGHFHYKLKSDTVCTSMCLLGLTNRPEPVNHLDLIFTEFNKLSTTFVDSGVFQSDNCYLLFVIEYCKSSPTLNYDKFYHKQRFRGLLMAVWFTFKI